jgi:hypothetical protein
MLKRAGLLVGHPASTLISVAMVNCARTALRRAEQDSKPHKYILGSRKCPILHLSNEYDLVTVERKKVSQTAQINFHAAIL